MQLAKAKDLNLTKCKFFVLDECDKMLEKLGAQHEPSHYCLLCAVPHRYAPNLHAQPSAITQHTCSAKQCCTLLKHRD